MNIWTKKLVFRSYNKLIYIKKLKKRGLQFDINLNKIANQNNLLQARTK